jgi:hypothetical protein
MDTNTMSKSTAGGEATSSLVERSSRDLLRGGVFLWFESADLFADPAGRRLPVGTSLIIAESPILQARNMYTTNIELTNRLESDPILRGAIPRTGLAGHELHALVHHQISYWLTLIRSAAWYSCWW